MFEDLVSSLLSTYLGDYQDGMTNSELKISQWNGHVELLNLVVLSVLFDFRESKPRLWII